MEYWPTSCPQISAKTLTLSSTAKHHYYNLFLKTTLINSRPNSVTTTLMTNHWLIPILNQAYTCWSTWSYYPHYWPPDNHIPILSSFLRYPPNTQIFLTTPPISWISSPPCSLWFVNYCLYISAHYISMAQYLVL